MEYRLHEQILDDISVDRLLLIIGDEKVDSWKRAIKKSDADDHDKKIRMINKLTKMRHENHAFGVLASRLAYNLLYEEIYKKLNK